MVPLAGHELTGQRLVGELPSRELVELWIKCSSRVVKRGFAIEYRDLAPPRTGIFDGLRIVLDPDVAFEMQCFILLHLFGHSVQWLAPSLAGQLDDLQHTADRAKFMAVLQAYEYQAARFAAQLMQEAGIRGLEQWFADFVETDWQYVKRYYETNQIPPWQECIVSGCPFVEPLAIPPLEHRQVEVRFAF
jgi:hypothetical protein